MGGGGQKEGRGRAEAFTLLAFIRSIPGKVHNTIGVVAESSNSLRVILML